jgi:L-malate glycosyltransferase
VAAGRRGGVVIRVLCVSSHRGAITNVRPEAEVFVRLQQRGLAFTVLTQEDSVYVPRMREAGIRVVDFEPRWRVDPGAIAQLRGELRRGQQQIIHLFNNKAITNGILASVGLPLKVVTYRGQTGNISRYDPSAYLTHLNPRVARVVCVAEAVRRDLVANGLPAHKGVTIYKGHDLDWYRAAPANLESFSVAPGALRIGLVANARPRKGIPQFLEAVRALPVDVPCAVLLVGAGMEVFQPQLAGMPKHVQVHLLGYRKDAAELIAACDISVLPALRREGLPKTVIEAMAAGVTPVVTDTGGNAELVEHGVSGLVVPPGDAPALTAALAQLGRDPALRKQYGAAARERIHNHFHVEQTVAKTLALYESLVAGSSRADSSRRAASA